MGTWEQGSPMRHASRMKRWAKFWMDGVPWMSFEGGCSLPAVPGVPETKMTKEGWPCKKTSPKMGSKVQTDFCCKSW